MRNDFGYKLRGRKFSKIEDYGLNSEFKQELKKKFDYYSDNPELYDEKLLANKQASMKNAKQINEEADALKKRGIALTELMNNVSKLEGQSNNFLKAAMKVRKKEGKKSENSDKIKNKYENNKSNKEEKKLIKTKEYITDDRDHEELEEYYDDDIDNMEGEGEPYMMKCACQCKIF